MKLLLVPTLLLAVFLLPAGEKAVPNALMNPEFRFTKKYKEGTTPLLWQSVYQNVENDGNGVIRIVKGAIDKEKSPKSQYIQFQQWIPALESGRYVFSIRFKSDRTPRKVTLSYTKKIDGELQVQRVVIASKELPPPGEWGTLIAEFDMMKQSQLTLFVYDPGDLTLWLSTPVLKQIGKD